MEFDMQSVQNTSQKNFSQERLESFCNEILNLDPKIRFVGIITDKGKLLAENKRKGLKVFIDPKDLEILLMETALGVRMRRVHDDQLGPVNFTISYGQNSISIIFPLETQMLCITAEKDLDFLKIPFFILKLLEEKIVKKD
ncbi:DUF6659 family protein [Candidatus Nitrosotalea bavarica]|jgi:hypothetical protein|uniref:DUF6659 family protein n=1 Tax=Candidatus Nitrosotalea bavarica TaxID=1903277 RepID=UPI000C70EC93|nr:DUF6659 family protein [Candidatus Nitrosotalea bavarica]